MIHNKKALGIFVKLIFLVIIVLIAYGFVTSLIGNTKKAASSLVEKNLNQFEMEGSSLVHPDLQLAQRNFWHNEFKNMIDSALASPEGQKEFCSGTFYTPPDFKGLKGWSISFLQEGENIRIQLEDNRGIIGATTGADLNDKMAKKTLCIKKTDGSETDVQQITIKFSNVKSYYYTKEDLQKSTKHEFDYNPALCDLNQFKSNTFMFDWLSKDSAQSNLFIFLYDRTPDAKGMNKLCIPPMNKDGAGGAISFASVKNLLSSAASSGNFEKFCQLPETAVRGGVAESDRKACFYTPCAAFSNTNANAPSIIETGCGQFSRKCGRICLLSSKTQVSYMTSYSSFYCESCAKYSVCTDIKNKESCESAADFCVMNPCKWENYKCVSVS
jgi:hypothetical protein